MTDFLEDYKIINNLPYGFDFQNQNLRQLRAHKEWFLNNKEYRLAELQKVFHAYCGECLDYSPESLKSLSDFFYNAIETEKLPDEKYAELRVKYPPEIPVNDYDLTVRSRSIIVDVGIYLGEVMIRNHKSMCWEQYMTQNKRVLNRGFMVITIDPDAFASTMNPIRICFVMGEKVADDTFKKNELYNLYKVYNNRVSPRFI